MRAWRSRPRLHPRHGGMLHVTPDLNHYSSKTQAFHPEPYTLNPEPYTFHPEPYTLNPKTHSKD
jgi:hypothetical protein